jgi:salicylate hydroxylase
MAFEDSFILSNILGKILNEPSTISTAESEESEILSRNTKIESCFRAYDEVRRPRTQAVTRTSREMGQMLGFAGEGIGRDLEKMKANLDTRMNWIWDIDLLGKVEKGVKIAKGNLKSML